MSETSLLLGAGFSVNKGYPTANQLNQILSELSSEDFWVYTGGDVILKERNEEDPCSYSHYSIYKQFVVKLINFYSENNVFNYEEFYDFYNEIYRGEKENKDFEKFCDDFRKSVNDNTDNQSLLHQTNSIYNQLIGLLLVDWEGKKYYDPTHHCKPRYRGYSGFLNCLEEWGDAGIAHIHTLNHDLFFEIFKSSDWLEGELSDGFIELGSPYYGNLSESYKVRLPYFTNQFMGRFRFYKLHGSVDQLPFHIMNKGIDTYVKIKFGIGTTELYKEVLDINGNPSYINDWINYHPDFLSGTTSKILRYREPHYYEKIFSHFEKNLSMSERLILIGYGCGDIEVNNIIEKNFDFKNKSLFVVDPFPSKKTFEFVKKFNAKLIEKDPEGLNQEDFIQT